MTKTWIAVNLLLLAVAAFLGWQLRVSILQFNAENNPAAIQPARDVKQRLVQEKPAFKQLPARSYNPAEFSIIPDKNVFAESRTKEDKLDNVAPPEPPPLAQKPILVATTMIDSQWRASIIDPTASIQGRVTRPRQGQIKKVGDVYQGYTIIEISQDRMVLESGTRKETIPLHEGSKSPQMGKTPILTTRIVSFGGGGVTGGTPVSSAGTASAPPRVPAPQAGQPGVQPLAPGRSPAPAPPPPQAAPTAAPGTRVIKTPFGDIVRPIE
jgi:hypothetical protein